MKISVVKENLKWALEVAVNAPSLQARINPLQSLGKDIFEFYFIAMKDVPFYFSFVIVQNLASFTSFQVYPENSDFCNHLSWLAFLFCGNA